MAKRNSGKRSNRRTAETGKSGSVSTDHAEILQQPRAGGIGYLFYVAVFLSAFLLFQVQPLIGKAILPWFGGSPAVWTTSMLFFQVMLLIGYAGAHVADRWISPRVQLMVYAALVLVSLITLPILPNVAWKPTGAEDPTWHILALLTQTIGLPFLVLSANSPLVQVWFHRATRAAPYRLYALSNLGSMLGLLTYPFLIEPRWGLRAQSWIWSVGYVVLVCLTVTCCFVAGKQPVEQLEKEEHAETLPAPGWRRYAIWLLLSAIASTLLLALTNHITQNVAVVPFLWVVPLAIYLSTFILVFASDRYYHRGIFGGLMMVSLFGCAMLFKNDIESMAISLAVHFMGLFAGCMVCHGELVRSKPHARYLTGFYLAMSLGGALGGIFVSLIAPIIFLDYWEYPLILTACWLVTLVVALKSPTSKLHAGKPVWIWGLLIVLFMAFLIQVRDGLIGKAGSNLLSHRDFYGVLAVRASERRGHPLVELTHGTTLHGAQVAEVEREFEPTTYYVAESGLGDAMKYVQGRANKRVGVLGMGVATIATYCEPGDTFRFYEIDPNVVRVATDPEIFTFWSLFEKRTATAEVVTADARIALERELDRDERQAFDVLVLDAFTGDAVPAHLLTKEAFAVYWQHMADDGVIAIHISNRFLDLLPVISTVAGEFQRSIAFVTHQDRSEWVLMAKEEVIQTLKTNTTNDLVIVGKMPRVLWTDDFSDLFRILK